MGYISRGRERAAAAVAASRAAEAHLNSELLGFPDRSVVGIDNDLDLVEYNFDAFGFKVNDELRLRFIDAKLSGSQWAEIPDVRTLNIAGADVRGAAWVHEYTSDRFFYDGRSWECAVVYDDSTVFDAGFVPPAHWCRVPVVTKIRDAKQMGAAFAVEELAASRLSSVRENAVTVLFVGLFVGVLATAFTGAMVAFG